MVNYFVWFVLKPQFCRFDHEIAMIVSFFDVSGDLESKPEVVAARAELGRSEKQYFSLKR